MLRSVPDGWTWTSEPVQEEAASAVRLAGPNGQGKRLFDIFFSLLVLTVGAPLLAAIALLVLVGSGWPVFYTQVRLGRGGVPFRIVKFRTMVRGADRLGPAKTSPDDWRVTPVGRFLRRTSLDELPQFWNVLKGEMSVVGPRPMVPESFEEHPERRDLLAVRPGLTGLAQVSGRQELSLERRIALDREYLRSWSLMSDLRILARTVWVLFGDRGAF